MFIFGPIKKDEIENVPHLPLVIESLPTLARFEPDGILQCLYRVQCDRVTHVGLVDTFHFKSMTLKE